MTGHDEQNQLRIAQIGCGNRGKIHIQAMRDVDKVDLVALCDIDGDKLTAAGEKFGVERRYTDLAEMIQAEQPQLVNIVTPPQGRLAIIEAAIAAGAPALLIEKPMALTRAELDRLRELGQDRLIAVNTQYRWMGHWAHFWARLDDGVLGQVRLLRASTRVNLFEQGPHILDLVLHATFISGLPEPEWVLAAGSGTDSFGNFQVPADTSATIGLGEARLHFNAGPSAPEVPGENIIWYQQQVEVIGDRGRLWVSLNQGWKLWCDARFESGKTVWANDDGVAQRGLFYHLWSARRTSETAWRAFPTRVEIAGRNAEILFACQESIAQGKRIELGALI
jgi:predicted dehydrogenase